MMLQVNVKKVLVDAAGREFRLDVSFEAVGGFTVITGPSGGGKTSTLNMLAGILRPDFGRISLAGRSFFDSVRGMDVPIRERRVGFVFQDYALFPHLTAAENVAYGIKNGGDRLAKAIEWMETFHIAHTRSRRPAEMSGGEQQRAAVARALASDPSVMLLDEPLSAVDVETRSRLLDEIISVQQRTNIPFLYVTHNEVEAGRLGGRIVRIDQGRAVSE